MEAIRSDEVASRLLDGMGGFSGGELMDAMRGNDLEYRRKPSAAPRQASLQDTIGSCFYLPDPTINYQNYHFLNYPVLIYAWLAW